MKANNLIKKITSRIGELTDENWDIIEKEGFDDIVKAVKNHAKIIWYTKILNKLLLVK